MHCLLMRSKQLFQKNQSTVFFIEPMFSFVTTQRYFFVNILGTTHKFADEERDWILVDLSKHIKSYWTVMTEVIKAKHFDDRRVTWFLQIQNQKLLETK
jgi:hypothetical protein